MNWIKVNASLRTNPKLVTLASRLSVTSVTAMGAMCHAWMIADEHANADGIISGVTGEFLDSLIGIDGLAESMEKVGWLIQFEGGLEFPNYAEHNGSTAKTRALGQKRQAKARKKKVVTPKRDKSVTREEKRREEKNRYKGDVCEFDEPEVETPRTRQEQEEVYGDRFRAMASKLAPINPIWSASNISYDTQTWAYDNWHRGWASATDDQLTVVMRFYTEAEDERLCQSLDSLMKDLPKQIERAHTWLPANKPKTKAQLRDEEFHRKREAAKA